jgi:hypothetical protein
MRINRAVMWMANGGMAMADLGSLELLDARGQPLQRLNPEAQQRQVPANAGPQTVEVTYQARAGQAEPARLVWYGRRNVLLEVPFTLKDVPLP